MQPNGVFHVPGGHGPRGAVVLLGPIDAAGIGLPPTL